MQKKTTGESSIPFNADDLHSVNKAITRLKEIRAGLERQQDAQPEPKAAAQPKAADKA